MKSFPFHHQIPIPQIQLEASLSRDETNGGRQCEHDSLPTPMESVRHWQVHYLDLEGSSTSTLSHAALRSQQLIAAAT